MRGEIVVEMTEVREVVLTARQWEYLEMARKQIAMGKSGRNLRGAIAEAMGVCADSAGTAMRQLKRLRLLPSAAGDPLPAEIRVNGHPSDPSGKRSDRPRLKPEKQRFVDAARRYEVAFARRGEDPRLYRVAHDDLADALHDLVWLEGLRAFWCDRISYLPEEDGESFFRSTAPFRFGDRR